MTTRTETGGAVRFAAWLAAALCVNLIAFYAARTINRPVVAMGAAFDVAVTVPALYYWLVVRAGVLPAVSMVPLCLVALLRATFVAPGVAWTRPALGALAELAVMSFLLVRLRRGMRAGAGESDIVERLTVPLERLPLPAAAAILASEIAVFSYAFGPWGRKPHVPGAANPYSMHRETHHRRVFWALAGLSTVEALVAHIVVRHWSHTAAWILTGLGAYAVVWMIAVARSLPLRPILVQYDRLTIRCGILWTLRVARPDISMVRRGGAEGVFHLPAGEPAECGARIPAPAGGSVYVRLEPESDL